MGTSYFKSRTTIWTERYLTVILASCINGDFSYGYNIYIISKGNGSIIKWAEAFIKSTKKSNEEYYKETGKIVFKFDRLDFLKASFSIGILIGTLVVVYVANAIGRKGGLIMSSILTVFGSLCCGYAKYFESFALFVIGRMLIGVKSGINSCLEPMYLSEILPRCKRIYVGPIITLFISLGSIFGWFASRFLDNEQYWPLLPSLNVIFAIILLILLPRFPESQYFLYVVRGRAMDCRKSLALLRGRDYSENEFNEIRNEYNQRKTYGVLTLKSMLENNILRKALVISTVLMTSQQLSGSGMLKVYINYYFENYAFEISEYFLLIREVVIFLVTSCVLAIHDKIDRKYNYMWGYFIMGLAAVGICFLFVIPHFYATDYLICFVSLIFDAGFSIGVGSMIYGEPSFLFNASASPIAYSIGVGSVMILRIILIVFVTPFFRYLNFYSAITYSLTNLFYIYFVYYKYPKGTNFGTLKEIYRNLR